MKTLFRFTITFMLAMLAWTCCRAAQDVTFTWTAPTEGSPVVVYQVQLSENGGPYTTVSASETDTQYTFSLDYGTTYTVRVAGVDAQGRRGPWSLPSDPYTPDLGPPGTPGKPSIVQIVAGIALLLLGLLIGRIRK